MTRYFDAVAAVVLMISASTTFAQTSSAAGTSLERWRTYTGVTWAPSHGNEPVSVFENSVNTPIAGIHLASSGMAFVSTPRLITADAPATLSLLDTNVTSGPARLTAFPSAEANAVAGAAALHLRNVLGFYVDRTNGWIWALDQGYAAGEAEAPPGGQKVMIYDGQSGRLVARVGLDELADRKGSFLNDIVVDEKRRVAYISDSGLRSAPDNLAGLIVVDLDAEQSRRVLHRHPSVLPEPGVNVVSHGAEVWPQKPLKLGVNGIALSPDGETLYWTVTTGHLAHSVPTRVLRDPHAAPGTIEAAIRELGDIGGNTDGIVVSADGSLYMTDVTRNGIVRYDPSKKTMELAASHPQIYWPDTPTMAPDGTLLFTSSNLHQHFAGAVKAGEERYEIWRLALKSKPCGSIGCTARNWAFEKFGPGAGSE